MGLGGWMLQEPYMLQTSGFTVTQKDIRQKISDLIGDEKTEDFYNAWYANHARKIDIDSLKAWGFNSVRLPMHYNLYTLSIEEEPVQGENTWLKEGFAMTDSLLNWCKSNQMYLILDLHGAPGGQGKNASISDYDITKPSLWESEANKQKTIALWKKLAEHYANEPWIGGYDLLNEPNWTFENKSENGCDDTCNAPIWNIYKEITSVIRTVDKNHIIFVEGNCWSQNILGFSGPWDDNMSLSFHKYWTPTDFESLEKFLEIRSKYNIPLWMGESGENSNEWFRRAIELFEQNEIGWAWWPMKKIGSIVGPLTIVKTPEYQQLLDYWRGKAPAPNTETAYKTLMDIADGLKLENCTYHPDVIDAMFRQQKSENSIPFTKNEIPGIIRAVDFDLGVHEIAYSDSDYMNTGVNRQTGGNRGGAYRNDGVDIRLDDGLKNDFYVTKTEDGEWMKYTVYVLKSGNYDVSAEVSPGEKKGGIQILFNDQKEGLTLIIPEGKRAG
ncbi:MAG: cellulase family glycosylhydrolase [Bacteroidales bacterium]|nr:cellulase family glycosylhydrolase [Bacteroidales bacterium]